jgi:signal transduction histidine kinase
LSRTNTNKGKINLTEFDVLNFCRQILRQTQRTFAKDFSLNSFLYIVTTNTSIKNFHLETDLPSLNVKMDEKLLRQILTNLLTNSIKYSLDNKNIDFQITVESDTICFVITDRGIGICKEDLEHLFSAFHRGKNVGVIPGTGLGLSIVKNCIDIYNGKISVESQLEIGTTFTVVLPISV